MKYTAQVIYTDFTEVFDVELDHNKVEIKLSEILQSPHKADSILALDLSCDIKSSYSVFPYEPGDLAIIQVKNHFIVALHRGGDVSWLKFTSNDLLEHLLPNDVTKHILPYLQEDKHIALNSFLSDLIRNDFSFSDLNKKAKYLKVAALMSFIKEHLQQSYQRVILDETLLGDVDVEHIAIAFRFSGQKFLRLAKINNVSKILALLEREGILDKKFKFLEDAVFINNPNDGHEVKLVFSENNTKFDYKVMPSLNYRFDLKNKEYLMTAGNFIKERVRGKIFVYNGDERDLMID